MCSVVGRIKDASQPLEGRKRYIHRCSNVTATGGKSDKQVTPMLGGKPSRVL
jgi:hypothetical protein